jgi:hypothetical protein
MNQATELTVARVLGEEYLHSIARDGGERRRAWFKLVFPLLPEPELFVKCFAHFVRADSKGWNHVLHKAPRLGRLTFSKTLPLFWRSEMMQRKLQQTVHAPRLEPQYQVAPKTMERTLYSFSTK